MEQHVEVKEPQSSEWCTALGDERFDCHHEAELDISRAGGFLFVIGSFGLVISAMSLYMHDDPAREPTFGLALLGMSLVIALPALAVVMIRQWAWIDHASEEVVQSRRWLWIRWVDRALPLDGRGTFQAKLYNENAEGYDRYFGCYYKHGYDEIVLLEAETLNEAEEHAKLLRERFPHGRE